MSKGQICLILSIIGISVLLSIIADAKAELPIEVHIGTFELPPLYHTSVSNDLSGTIGETVKELLKIGNMSYRLSMWPVKRAYRNIEIGKSEILITGRHARFNESATSSDWFSPLTSGVFSEKPLSEIPKNEQEFIGTKIIIIRDWQSPYKVIKNLDHYIADKKIDVHWASSLPIAIRMFDAKRAPFLWGSENFIWTFKNMNLNDRPLHFKELMVTPMVLWVSKKSKNHDEILRRLNKAFKTMKDMEMLNEKNLLKNTLMSNRIEEPYQK